MTGVNDPHPNETPSEQAVADPEDFFGPESGNGEGEEVDGLVVDPDADADIAEIPEPEPEPEVESVEPEPAAEVQPEPEPEAPVVLAEEPAGAGEAETDGEDKGNKREYVILQEIVLDQDTLADFLKQVKGGIDPIVALVEVHRETVTTAKAALGGAWKAHKDQWEAPPRLAAVSANKLKVRTLKVKTREVTGFEFE